MSPSSDYLAIGVKDGHATLGWNLGSGEIVITYNESRIDDGRWHKIRAQRYLVKISTQIGNLLFRKYKSKGKNAKSFNSNVCMAFCLIGAASSLLKFHRQF